MILLEEFLSKIYSYRDKSAPMVWIYDGYNVADGEDKEECLLAVFKSCYVPSVSLSEKLLKKHVEEIYRTPDGIAVGVIDGEGNA